MIDQEKYPKLYKAIEDIIKMRQDWLDEALKARELAELLPDEIKGMDITYADFSSNKLTLNIDNKDATLTTLKTLGVQGLKIQVNAWMKGYFHAQGDGVLPDGSNFRVFVSNVDKPEGCRVEERVVTRTENVLVCEQTGQPV